MHTQNFFDISEHNGCTRGVLRSPLEVPQYVATRRLVPLHPDPLPQGTYLVSVGSVAEAAYGGRPVESRKNTGPKVPSGTTESSPRFQPWVAGGKSPEPRRGERKDETGATRSFVPDGTRFIFASQPSDESLGYSRTSLRDVDSRHAKHVRQTPALPVLQSHFRSR